MGWTDEPTSETPKYLGSDLPSQAEFLENKTLYAVWYMPYCYITLDPMGGENDEYT